ncbi:MAG: phosphoglycerate dehydrogenase [Planctomycetota bacterium]|jgi:D-3-phosphoglycerate dehydrogenase
MPTSYPLESIKVVLLESIHDSAAEAFGAAGYSVTRIDGALRGRELIEAAGDAHILGIRSRSRVDREFLEAASHLWAVGCFCIGSESVDMACASDRGVAVFNAPFSNTRSVAELTISEAVALSRRLFERSSKAHRGEWDKSASGSREVRGQTMGIIGYGRIGSQVSHLAEAMGMRVLFFDVTPSLPMGNAVRCDSMERVLRESDIVTVHVPGSESTRGLIGRDQIGQMKPGAMLINNARGDVLDQDALAEAIGSGHLSGAAVDVYPVEPSSRDEPLKTPLAGFANVILSPHIGGSTLEAQESIGQEVASKLIRFMNNGSTTTSLNMPEVDLPVLHEDKHRVLHYHANTPGVLSRLHGLISELGINIHSEYLQTTHSHGYVILDVEPTQGEALGQKLKRLPDTIRVRTLW